jgi:hypothetical protein
VGRRAAKGETVNANEITRYEFKAGRAIEFSRTPDGRLGASTAVVAAFYGVSVNAVKKAYENNKGEFRTTETWVEIVVSSQGPEGAVAVNPHPVRFFDPYGVLRVGMKLTRSDTAIEVRDFILYTIIPDYLGRKKSLDVNETLAIALSNAQGDLRRALENNAQVGSLASGLLRLRRDMLRMEREAELFARSREIAHELFPDPAAAEHDGKVLAALVAGPAENVKELAKRAKLTMFDAARALQRLVRRGLVHRVGCKIDLKRGGQGGEIAKTSCAAAGGAS